MCFSQERLCEDTGRRWPSESWKKALTRNQSGRNRDLSLLACRTARKYNGYHLNHPGWHFVLAALVDECRWADVRCTQTRARVDRHAGGERMCRSRGCRWRWKLGSRWVDCRRCQNERTEGREGVVGSQAASMQDRPEVAEE